VRARRVRNAKDRACREPVAGFAMTVAGMTAMTVSPSPRDDSVADSGKRLPESLRRNKRLYIDPCLRRQTGGCN
jgi:hypothetical protein